MAPGAEFDVLVYGATGFVGRRVARLLLERDPKTRIGLCGRSPERLEKLRDDLAKKLEAAGVRDRCGVVEADSTEKASVDAAVARARIVVACAGPFTQYGTPVVSACVKRGVHYLDITGETPWVRGLISRYHEKAKAAGTVLIPFSGVDSVPSDLGAWMAVRALRDRYDEGAANIVAGFAAKAGLNGGTAQSALALYADPDTLAAFQNPLVLCPELDARGVRDDFPDLPTLAPDSQSPVVCGDGLLRGPYVMGAINARVVMRSAYLYERQGEGYGPQMQYREVLDLGRSASTMKAYAVSSVMSWSERLLKYSPTRKLIGKLAPSPGEGPSDAVIDGGYTRGTFWADGERGAKIQVRFHADGDPGNAVTASLIVESARCLIHDAEALGVGEEGRGGFLTPAFALGDALVKRLRGAGMTLDVVSDDV